VSPALVEDRAVPHHGLGPAIETDGLAKRYGRTMALDGLTMQVGRGRVFGFLGPNGAGKTTAVKLLLGLARPTAGSARLLGAPIGDRATRARVGYLPELFRYQSWLTARDVLGLHADLAGLSPTHRPGAIDDALATVGLADRGSDRVGTFSKGMQQRLGLGVALLGRPELVFLDEPTSALDPVGRQDVRAIIHDLRERGTTVFLNSHLLTEVERVCDEVAIVDHGRVVASGPLGDLLGDATVRIRTSGERETVHAVLAPFGAVSDDPPWTVVRGCPLDRVPELVAALVAVGAPIHGVEAGRETLEEHFLELLGHRERGASAEMAADGASGAEAR